MKTLPEKEDILRLLADAPAPMTKREIVRAFGITGDLRRPMKALLREMEANGHIVKQPGQIYSVPEALPAVTVVQVSEIDIDGDVFARPADWDEEVQGEAPRIEILPDQRGHPAVKEGDRILVRLRKYTDRFYEGNIIRRLDDPRGQVMGELQKTRDGFMLQPASKKAKYGFDVAQKDLGEAKAGDLVVGEIQPARGLKRKKVRIVRVIGARDDPEAISLIALHEAGLHESFTETVLAETKGLEVPALKGREDLRGIPLVTIDGADARDFDDAVFAEETEDGFHLIVAIADVAYYVRPGSALDREAYRRGNSTYFPDRVVPMLPEALSNDLCSLRPNENRACMAFHLWIDREGSLTKHKIVRGIMRSAARLVYEQVQHTYDTLSLNPSPSRERESAVAQGEGEKLWPLIQPLYAAYDILDKARQKRGALDLDLPERQILIDEKGKMTGVINRPRFDAHKLIEEFMILANIAAAQTLEARKAPCVYRVHDRPSPEKLDAAREFVSAFDLPFPKGSVARPGQINEILKKAAALPYAHLIGTVILRTQSQAVYDPENIGHFGLALRRYAHFTSPIRRYADLLVHRSLIQAYGLGPGGMEEGEAAALEEKAQHISQTERTSAEAERSAVDRFTAQWMSERIGAEFSGKISGVTRFGLFVTLDENGADGLIPMRALPDDYYIHDEQQHALIGRRDGRIYRLGASLAVRLKEADGLTGSSIFELIGDESADIPGVQFRKIRPRPPSRPKPHRKGRKPAPRKRTRK
ncbi:MAG: ribonuclease R [Rhodospirillales bacterium]|nr:ribonuclease R [Alphaproteobacteria bacterium]USO03759.1 MAG: ribonuclease R [Rhodospirillales bacterium]